jgi:hypothetical protein
MRLHIVLPREYPAPQDRRDDDHRDDPGQAAKRAQTRPRQTPNMGKLI